MTRFPKHEKKCIVSQQSFLNWLVYVNFNSEHYIPNEFSI